MDTPCSLCGAPPLNGKDCETIYNEFLVLEFTDPGYGEVHFLTVACYMTQHGRFSDEGLAWIKEKLRLHLEEGLSVAAIRDENRDAVSNQNRAWKVTRPPEAPPAPTVGWSMTIADVAKGYIDASTYRTLITEWAKTTLAEMP